MKDEHDHFDISDWLRRNEIIYGPGDKAITGRLLPRQRKRRSKDLVRLLLDYWRLNESIRAHMLIRNILRPRKEVAQRARLADRIIADNKVLHELDIRIDALLSGHKPMPERAERK